MQNIEAKLLANAKIPGSEIFDEAFKKIGMVHFSAFILLQIGGESVESRDHHSL